MFSILPFKRKKVNKAPEDTQHVIAYGIVHKCLKIQSKWAAYMQRKSEQLSSHGKKYLLVLFCFLAGGASIYTIADNLSSSKKKAFTIPALSIPVHIGKAGEERKYPTIIITKAQIDKIRRFQRYMDSLDQSTDGKRLRDSILLFRPGLMDSLRFIENLYQLQSPNQ